MANKKQTWIILLLLTVSCFQLAVVNGQDSLIRTLQDSLVTKQKVSFNGHLVSGKIVTLTYETLPGNDPNKNKNWVGIWQGNQVSYLTPPLRKAYISGTTSTGDFAFDSLSIQKKEYIIAYGSGSSATSIAATLYFKADIKTFEAGVPFSTQVGILEKGNNYIVVNYKTPAGNMPSKHKNWIGIWAGQSFSSNGSNLIKRKNVNSIISVDAVAINDLNLTRNAWYTITYGTGPSLTEIVATYTFLNN